MRNARPRYAVKKHIVYYYNGRDINVRDIRHLLQGTHKIESHHGRFFLRRTDGRPCHFEFDCNPWYLVRHPDSKIHVYTEAEFKRWYE